MLFETNAAANWERDHLLQSSRCVIAKPDPFTVLAGCDGEVARQTKQLRRGYHRDAGWMFFLDYGRLMGDPVTS